MNYSKILCIAFIAASVFVATYSAAFAATRSNIDFLNAKLKFKTEQTKISGVLAKPDGNGPFPAVVLLHTCGEMRAHVSHEWPDYLTKLGYVTLTPDSAGSRNIDGCDGGVSKEEVGKALRETARDAYGALKYLSTLPYIDKNNVAVMGFSFGANVINTIVMNPKFQRGVRFSLGMNFKAGIVFYGRCRQLKNIQQTPFPVIQIIGSNDSHAKECSELGHHSIKVHMIPGAYHTFDSREKSGQTDVSGNLKIYDEEATALSREITKKFLKQETSKPSPSRILGSPGGAGGPQRPTVGKAMARMDKNKDGLISKKEFLGPPQRFGFFDFNKDGQISADELSAAIAKRNARQKTGPRGKPSSHATASASPAQNLAVRRKGSQARKKSFLSEEKIRETVIGNTLNFEAPSNGKNLYVHFAKDGQVQMKVAGSARIIQKKWFFNDRGLLCRTFGRKNRNHCTRVVKTEDPASLTLKNKKVSYQAIILKGRQLSK